MIRSTLDNARRGRKNSSNAETMAVFGMMSMVMIFAPLLLLLIRSFSGDPANVKLPAAFHLSTLVILGSSYTLSRAKTFKEKDLYRDCKWQLTATLVLSVIFLILQSVGWSSLVNQYRMQQHTINFIIVLALIHGAHLLMGLVILLLHVKKIYPLKSGAELYIHFLNPSREVGFKVLFNYWHFVDLLWILMYIIFVIKLA